MTHSAGPWKATNNGTGYSSIYDCGGVEVCTVSQRSRSVAVDDNIKLIQASPELLAAAKMLLWYFDSFRDVSPVGATEKDDIASARKLIESLSQ